MTDIGLLVSSANPVPDHAAGLTDDERAALLLLAKQRSTDVDAKQATQPMRPDKRERPKWLVAVAAFAVVLIVTGLAVFLTGDPDEAAPAVTDTTEALPITTVVDATSTTEPEPTVSEEQLAVLAAFQDAFNAGDEAALRATLHESVTYVDIFYENSEGRDADWIVEWMVHQNAMETVMDIHFADCRLAGSSVQCDVGYVGDVPRIILLVDDLHTDLFTIADGRIAAIKKRCKICGLFPADEVRDWVKTQNIEEANLMAREPDVQGTAESGRLWLKWTRLWDEAGRP